MGCGASTAPYQPTDAAAAPAPESSDPVKPEPTPAAPEPSGPVEVQVEPAAGGDGAPSAGITLAEAPPPEDADATDDPSVPRGPFLPFARFDKTAIPKEIMSQNIVYIQWLYNSKVLGGSEAKVEAECTDLVAERAFVVQRVKGEGPLMDGDDVLLMHADDGLYLEAHSDQYPVKLAARNTDAMGQSFRIFKQGRPLAIRHRDTVYFQSAMCNYLEDSQTITGEPVVVARRWTRRDTATLTILKKEIVESKTTELARKMQFQAFDMDGNGAISRAELHFLLEKTGAGNPNDPAFLDGLMAELDPAGTGNIMFSAFSTWADGGSVMTEEQLQHAEVLGNIAQRCHDALNEESALIEVLTVAHQKVCTDMVNCYSKKFALDEGNPASLIADVNTKATEQDGWIFTNYWKIAMQGLMEEEVELWCRCLNDAMKCWGTDEYSLTVLVCTMPDRLRNAIFAKYFEKYGKGLLEHIESETSGSYKKVLAMQAMAPQDAKARLCYEAMKGLGTNEDQLIRVLTMTDIPERQQIKDAFLKMYDRQLTAFVESEISGNFKKAMTVLMNAEETEFDLEKDCTAMYEAMKGWGTDETKLLQHVCNKTAKQMELVNIKFREMYDRELYDFVKSETSGNFQAVLLSCIRHPMKNLAHAVRDCIKGWGTSETGLLTCLVHLPDFKKAALLEEYRIEHKRDLIRDIKGDCSGNYEKALLALVRPAPRVWAEAMENAMKGLGTNDQLLINMMSIAKDEMGEVRKYFKMLQQQKKTLLEWVEGDCSGDYKRTLAALVNRNTEDLTEMLPLYWAQRGRDAVRDIDTLKDILVQLPSIAIRRGTQVYKAVYGLDLKEAIEKKCEEGCSWFTWTDYYKKAMLKLLEMPVELYVTGLYEAMNGLGTDESSLTALVTTFPENMYGQIHARFQEKYGKSLIDWIEGDTSFDYKKAMVYQALSWPQSRAKALNTAMAGMGTDEGQLIRIAVCTTMRERAVIRETYREMFDKNLITHIEEETSGSFAAIMVALFESTDPQPDDAFDFENDCNILKEAIDGIGTDEDQIVRVLAGKTPEQRQIILAKYNEMFGEDLYQKIDDETWDPTGIFQGGSFRTAILNLMRTPIMALANCVRDCIVGLGTDDTGLITCLVHLSERKKLDLFEAYKDVRNGGNLYDHLKGDTTGSYEYALLCLTRPAPVVWSEALKKAMKGLGTSDNLLINFMCIAKDRMDEVRAAFIEQTGQELAQWLDGDLGDADYKDLMIRLANRKVMKFPGSDVMLTTPPPPSKERAVYQFNCVFNELCKKKKADPGTMITPDEEAQQAMGPVFMYYGKLSSCAPNLDRNGVWDLTNAVGFPPADDGEDLTATFTEWNYSGSGEITWNDFVREMGTRINDPNHYEAEPLPENEP